jgi:glycosyltransferase involved in cell wall biosynthesis
MNKESLVSIIIPSYNCETTIANTINSVLKQTYNNYEIIIVDDVSTDKTSEICLRLSKESSKIKYFKLEKNSGGPSYPSNFGVSKANGDYIAFLDHDDKWLPEKLEKQISFLIDNNLDMVSCYILSLDNEKKQVLKIFQKPPYLNEILQRNFLTSTSTIVIKKEVFEKIGGFDINLKGPQDWDLYINFFTKGFNFGYVKEVLAMHLNLKNSLSSMTSYEKFEKDRLYMFNKYLNYYENDNKVLSNYFRSVGIQYLALNKKNKALEMIHESIKKNPFNFKSYLYIPIISSTKLFRFLLTLKIKISNLSCCKLRTDKIK